jgi:hypothetical protein
MSILSQSGSFSYSLFPPYPLLNPPPARLLLPAPKGYQYQKQQQAPITITYSHELLRDLDEAQRDRLLNGITTLLDVSIGQMLGLLNMDAFRAAQVAFSRAITGEAPPRPNTPAAFHAEMDAWLIGEMVLSTHGEKAARAQDERIIDGLLKAIRETRHD